MCIGATTGNIILAIPDVPASGVLTQTAVRRVRIVILTADGEAVDSASRRLSAESSP